MALPSYEELVGTPSGDLPSYEELTREVTATNNGAPSVVSADSTSAPAIMGDLKVAESTMPPPVDITTLPPDDPRRVRAVRSFGELWKLYRETEQQANTSGTKAMMNVIGKTVPAMSEESGGAGLAEASRAVEGLISPQNAEIAGLGSVAPVLLPLIGAGFAAPAAKTLVSESGPEVVRSVQEHGLTSPEAGKAITKAGTDLFMATGGAKAMDVRPTGEARVSTESVDSAMDDLLKKSPEELIQPETTNAERTGNEVNAPGEQAPPVEQGTQERVRVRDDAQDRLEAQSGERGQPSPEVTSKDQSAPPSVQDIVPAIKVGGELVRGEKGDTHQDILDRFVKQNPEKEADALVDFDTKENPNLFVDKAGNEISREQLQKQFGVRDSQGLREAQAKGEAPTSEGPGAAAATEPLASYEKRRFGERFQESKDIGADVREATGNRYYEPIPNITTVKEAEAIIEQRGTDEGVRLVRDESFPMEHRVRATMAQGLIKKLNQSHAEAVKAGDKKAADGFLNQAVDTAEYLSELGTKLGQGVQSFAIWSRLTPEGLLMAAKRSIKKARLKAAEAKKEIPKDLDPKDLEELTRMAADIDAAPEGFQRNEKMADFLGKIADLKGADLADLPTAIYYANILSGYTTQLKNTVDTALNVFSEASASALSHPTAVPDILSGLYRGILKGGIEAASVVKTGRGRENKLQVPQILERTRFGEKGGVPIKTDTALGRVMKAGFETKPARILNLWKYPLRAMVASDTVFYNSMKEARSRVLARAIAKKEGLRGQALFQRVDEILNRTPERLAQIRQKAESEGLTGQRLTRRINEIEEQGRPEELVNNADEAAAIATYNHDPTGVLGVIASKINEMTQAVPIGKAVVPFTRIVANVANRSLDYTPWGYKRLFFGQGGGERFATEPPVGEAYRTQLAKATAGTVGMAAVAALDAAGTIQVTASGPQNQNEKHQLMNSGWKPYSVKVGNTWVSYQYTPLNLGLAMVGHYRDAIRYNKLDEKDAQTRLAYGMLKAGSTLFDMSFLSGLGDFMEAVKGEGTSTKGAGRMIARTGSSLVTPNLFKQIDRLFDPKLYDANTVQEMLIRETPIARSTMLSPSINVLGEPINLSSNPFFQRNLNDPVWKLIVDKQAFVPVPSKTRKIGDRPITPDEYRELIKQSGKEIREYIESNLGELQSLPAQEVQERVESASKSIRDSIIKNF